MVGVGLSLELVQLGHLESLSQRPLNDSAVSRHRDQALLSVLTEDPLDLPDDIVVLVLDVFG